MQKLELTLNGEIENIEALSVARALESLAKLIQAFPSNSGRVKMSGVRQSSVVTEVLIDDESLHRLYSGIKSISRTCQIPRGWNRQQLRYLREIAKEGQKTNGATLSIKQSDWIPIDADLKEAIEKALSASLVSIGSVTGELNRYNGSDSHELKAWIRDESTDASVKVLFSEIQREDVLSKMHKRVRVRGKVHRSFDTNQIELVHLYGVDVLPDRSLSNGRGIWSEYRQSIEDPVHFIDRLRSVD